MALLAIAMDELRAAQSRVDAVLRESTRILSAHGFEMATGTDRKRVDMWNAIDPDNPATHEAPPRD
jgi:hypothetical protein